MAWVIAGLTATIGRLPLPLLRPFVRALAGPAMRRRLGARASENLRSACGDVLSETEREAIVDEVFGHFAGLPAELANYAFVGSSFLDRHVEDEAALAVLHPFEESWRGGWIGLTGHIGNWELLGQWLRVQGRQPMAGILAKRQPNPHLNRLIEKFRGRQGMGTLYTDDSSRHLIRLLKSGHSMGVAADQDVISVASVFVDFFGRPAYTPVGPARLAWAANVPILVGAALRTATGFVVQINPPIWPDRSRPRDEELQRLTQEYTRQLEQLIREHPEQWAWFHRRWRTTPERLERYRLAGPKPRGA